MGKKSSSFEDKMARLEEIAGKLNNGKVSLDESLALYNEGCTLLSECEKLLTEAEQKVSILRVQDDETPLEVPFDE